MKNYKYKIIQLFTCCLLFAGCDKYLDITPKGKTLLNTVDDYDKWLNDEVLYLGLAQPSNVFNYYGDNVDYAGITTPALTSTELVYTWAPQPILDLNLAPLFWGEHYAKINLYNTVVIGVDNAIGGTTSKKKSLKAEAILGRSLEYFYLLNEYGKPYDAATAGQDLAVPFLTSNDVTQIVPPRSTVAEIYQRLIDDLNAAIPDLPEDNSGNRIRGSRAGAYSVLARLYFYARNYSEAQKNAELALANSRSVMIDYNGTLPSTNMLAYHPDVVYGRMVIGSAGTTLDFIRSFASNDLRVRKLYSSTDGYKFLTRGSASYYPAQITPVFTYTNTGTSVQEMKLIAAECAARANNLTVALQHLDEIRKNRFATASYVKYSSTIQEDVIQEILMERSHELPFNGLRWFDMRRLDKENRMGTVNRYNAQGDVVATLPPHSDKYTLQIPLQVLSYNPDMPQNP
ncbi:RagB/SusD family nutrient uptake outer membrane protein [Pedobacter metabolipauper]|uniref:SusD-like starch-binding protein associating with outer membrane n=1 Tax=Pedobacter metabolipauper TaxID=425513 RepID=A0A4R6SSW9_9SPHI|nr:RagB/SusD family nutrient uptake outer membrane protein [Pedobacter metabolipauper]TDQ07495.1 SusD-like starch-binding protein associating with outer membrane [Pedobacter metabolipauper]